MKLPAVSPSVVTLIRKPTFGMVVLSGAVLGAMDAAATNILALGLVIAVVAAPGFAVILCMAQEMLRRPPSLRPPQPRDGGAQVAGVVGAALGAVVLIHADANGLAIVTGVICWLGACALMGFVSPVDRYDRHAPLHEFMAETRTDSARMIENDELIEAGIIREF